jgi:hypothetical protein
MPMREFPPMPINVLLELGGPVTTVIIGLTNLALRLIYQKTHTSMVTDMVAVGIVKGVTNKFGMGVNR